MYLVTGLQQTPRHGRKVGKKNPVYLRHFFCMGQGHKSEGWYKHTRRSGLQEHVRADKKHVVLHAVHWRSSSGTSSNTSSSDINTPWQEELATCSKILMRAGGEGSRKFFCKHLLLTICTTDSLRRVSSSINRVISLQTMAASPTSRHSGSAAILKISSSWEKTQWRPSLR